MSAARFEKANKRFFVKSFVSITGSFDLRSNCQKIVMKIMPASINNHPRVCGIFEDPYTSAIKPNI